MKKYVFTIKKATKYGVEIEAENKNEAFKKIMNLATEDDEKNINNADIDKQIYRFKLKEIIEELWTNGMYIDGNTLYVNIGRLREKLSKIGAIDYVRTVRGVGYRL